jgi:hypothetical protein
MMEVDCNLSNAELTRSTKFDMKNPVVLAKSRVSVEIYLVTMNGDAVDGHSTAF